MNTRTLAGALVVITGASSGIGRATAQAFACQGARLVLAARDAEALREAVEECRQRGAEAIAVTTDVTLSDSVGRLASEAAQFGGGRIDIWINNAGVGAVGSFDETPMEAHEQVLQTDLLGYLRGAHAALPYFKQQNAGVLINTLSVGSWLAQPYAVAYSTAKFGLLGFCRALRAELRGWPGIHVCELFPAVVDTPGFRDAGNYAGRSLKLPPLLSDPRNVAEAMVSLALNPRARLSVGPVAKLMRLERFALPLFEPLYAWAASLALRRAERVPTSSGNLFHPPTGPRRIDGGWRSHKPVSRTLLLAGGGALVLLGVLMARRRRGD
jgi:short-subunit dehydrogenase